MKKPFQAMLGASALALAISPALAQQSGLVNVDISNVRTEIAKNLNIDVSQVPVTVQVPVGVAANVCNVAANVLAQGQQGQAGGCTATSASTALNQFVQNKSGSQNAGNAGAPGSNNAPSNRDSASPSANTLPGTGTGTSGAMNRGTTGAGTTGATDSLKSGTTGAADSMKSGTTGAADSMRPGSGDAARSGMGDARQQLSDPMKSQSMGTNPADSKAKSQ